MTKALCVLEDSKPKRQKTIFITKYWKILSLLNCSPLSPLKPVFHFTIPASVHDVFLYFAAEETFPAALEVNFSTFRAAGNVSSAAN